MELLGTAVRRVLQDARNRMDERKTGTGGEARPGKDAPGGGGAGVKGDRVHRRQPLGSVREKRANSP